MSDVKSSAGEATGRMSSPQPPSGRGRLEARHSTESTSTRRVRSRNRNSDSTKTQRFDTDAADHAFMRELQRPNRESTPGASPHRKRQRINGDRFGTLPDYVLLRDITDTA